MPYDLLKKLLAFAVATATFLYGNDPSTTQFVKALVVFSCFDIVIGLATMFYKREKFDYRFFARGIVKKALYLMTVSFGYFVDKYNIIEVNNVSLEKVFATAFCTVEVCSIVQSLTKCGIKIPFVDKFIKLD